MNYKEFQIQYIIPEDLWFFKGHFPGQSVFPGIMLISLGIEEFKKNQREYSKYMLKGISHCRFKKIIKPNDTLQLKFRFAEIEDNTIEINYIIEANSKLSLKARLILIKGAIDDS